MLSRNNIKEDGANFTVEIIATRDASIALVSGVLAGQHYLWTGTAKRCPEDHPVAETGMKLALARAFETGARQLTRQGYGALKNYEDTRNLRKQQMTAERDEAKMKFYRLRRRVKNRIRSTS